MTVSLLAVAMIVRVLVERCGLQANIAARILIKLRLICGLRIVAAVWLFGHVCG